MDLKIECTLILFLISTIDCQLKIAEIPKSMRGWGLNQAICGLTNALDVIETNWEPDCYKNKCCRNSYSEKEVYVERRGQSIQMPRIYKGKRIDNTESPWTVHIRPKRWLGIPNLLCTGVLITLEWVLTAAHCYEDWRNEDWFEHTITITAGSNITKLYTDGLQVRTNSDEKWYTHPKYVNPGEGEHEGFGKAVLGLIRSVHDIALFKVSKPFTRIVDNQKYRINTICLPQKMTEHEMFWAYKRPQNATLTGFSSLLPNKRSIVGIHDKVFRRTTGILRSGTVELEPYEDCELAGLLCSYSYQNQTRGCRWDSGGPLVQHFNNTIDDRQQKSILVGLVQGALSADDAECGDKVKETHYVVVPNFIDWIFDIISKH